MNSEEFKFVLHIIIGNHLFAIKGNPNSSLFTFHSSFLNKLKPNVTMRKIIISSFLLVVCLLTASAQSIYDFKVKNEDGNDVSLAEYKGKLLLVVNTATRCGFTPQYKELEAMYEKFRVEGLEILDFPCNQFGQQAPGSIEEIHQFCTANFNIQFPQFDKIEVNGENAHPLYVWLKNGEDIKWNFTKFLVSRDGKVLRRYEPRDKVSDIEADIQQELKR